MADYKQIPGLDVEALRANTHYEAMADVVAQANECQGVTQRCAAALQALTQAVAAEKSAQEESLKSQYTKPIAEKDAERDKALQGAKDALRAATNSPSASAKQAADHLANMTRLLKIKATPQYDQQTGEITIAVDELLGMYEPYTEAAGIKPYVQRLKQLNDEMCELLQLRDQERGEQGRSKVAERRKDSDKAYRELVRQVNALEIAFAIGQLQGQPEDDPFTPFINFMLGLIDRYKREILNRKKPDKEETVTDEVTEEVTQTPDGEETTETDTETDTETTLTPDTRTKKK